MGFVTAFAGRRDGYEVPAAFAEQGQLDAFVTDYYSGAFARNVARILPKNLASKVMSRSDERLPPEAIRRLHSVIVRALVSKYTGGEPDRLFERTDPMFGYRAADLARKHKSNLFMYSAYASEAFSKNYRHDPFKVLFQFHPHIDLEKSILEKDIIISQRNGLIVKQILEGTLNPGPSRIASDNAWRIADHIICASNFTKRSLILAGADEKNISVVPYGIHVPADVDEARLRPQKRFTILFVGTGLYRKGLHHLLEAWQRARLPKDANLVVVARSIEPALLDQLHATDGVTYRAGVSAQDLENLYRSSSLFAMPSLIEGFGQVFLEALSHGLPVLGTPNTCIPDLGSCQDGVFVVPPGDVEALTSMIESLAVQIPANPDMRQWALATARRHTWAAFREKIVQASVPR